MSLKALSIFSKTVTGILGMRVKGFIHIQKKKKISSKRSPKLFCENYHFLSQSQNVLMFECRYLAILKCYYTGLRTKINK